MTYQNQDVTKLLNKTLGNQRPAKRARDIIGHALPQRRRRWKLPSVAAALFIIMLVSSFTVPAVARAIGEAPLLGESFRKFLTGTSMDIAYQAGLVNELNRSDTKDGITFTILSAYSDATQSLISFQITSEDPAILEELWSGYPDSIFPKIYKNRPWGYTSFGGRMEYFPEEGIIYGLLDAKPLGWSLFGHKITAEIKSLGLSLTFPIQTIPSDLNERVRVNKTFEYDGLQITIEEIIFSPSATQVSYSYVTKGTIIEAKSWNISLRLADGTELRSFSGYRGGMFGRGKGAINYLPADSPDVTILFTGWNAMYQVKEVIPLAVGSSVNTQEGTITISGVVTEEESTTLSLDWSGLGGLGKVDVQLVDSQGKVGRVVEGEQTEDGLRLTISHGQLSGAIQLHINAIEIRVYEEIEIGRVVRDK